MKKIKVKEIVATNIIELFENELVSKALKKITSNRIHNIVVVNSDNSRSILSTTDILKNVLKEGWKNAKISSLFRRPLKTISEETSIVQAAISMEEGDEILGVLDGSQKLCGVVTHRDISDATEILNWQNEYSEELTAISVNSIITRNSAVTADFHENLYDKLPELNASPTDCLIALKEQKPCGIITKRDIIRLLDSDKNLDVKIEEHMSSPLFTLEGEVSVSSALISMQNRHFRRAIVLDDNGFLAGVVSQKAIISIIYNHAAKRMWHFNENRNLLLAKEVDKKTKELQNYQQKLESLVSERTKELEETNKKLEKEMLQRKKSDEILKNLVEGTSAATGKEFFRKLVLQLCKMLGVRYALVGRLKKGEEETVIAEALWSGNGFVDGYEYSLKGTPCENVVGKKICSYKKEVSALFPKDIALAKMNAHGYIGVPLFDSGKKALGVLVVIDDKPLGNTETAKSVMSIFASRVSAELERLEMEQALLESHKDLERKIERKTYDLNKRIKELRCLYEVSKLANVRDLPMQELLQKTAELTPQAFQYPQKTCANIIFKNVKYENRDTEKCSCGFSEDIMLRGKKAGKIEVFYIENHEEAPFLKEERELVKSICEWLGRIAERKEANEMLLMYEQIISASEDIMSLVDLNYTYLAVNDAYLHKHKKRREEIVGHTVAELIGESLFEKTLKPKLDECSGGNKIRFQAWVELAGSGKRYLDIAYHPAYTKDGAVRGVVVAARDISELKKTQEELLEHQNHLEELIAQRTKELSKTNEKLREYQQDLENKVKEEIEKRIENENIMLYQSRFAAMGEMISMIAHQWRQPLSTILLSVYDMKIKMEMGSFESGMFDEKIDEIEKYVHYMSGTIDDFRNFYKQDREKNSATLKETLDISLGIIKATLEANKIAISIRCEAKKPLKTYHNELTQVFLNILKNAQDAFLQKKTQKPKITIFIAEDNKYQTVTIADNAGGIPEDVADKIFDPYFSTKMNVNGTGLGLYMSKTIVEKHCKGSISAANIGSGAEFTVKIPLKT